jgi:SAM-dependent methyltransferase
MSGQRAPAGRLRRIVRRVAGRGDRDPLALSPEDRRYLTQYYDSSVPLPRGAAEELSEGNPRLRELRATYADLDLPASNGSRWQRESIDAFLDLRYFRGETLITWHYRELPRITRLKYFVLMRYIAERDDLALLDRLTEDGAFGCWTYSYPGYGTVSRDLLESVNEITFLERELGLSQRDRFSVLDVGAGYGRLAHRMTAAYPNLSDYCCLDAIPESTFLCEYYLRFRGCSPPARVVSLDAVDDLNPGGFDLAVNIHSFSECTLAAIAWWVDRLRHLQVPRLLVVPNEPAELLSLEADGSRRDFGPLLEDAGYRLLTRKPVVEDPAVRELVPLEDHFHLFGLDGGG